MTDKHSDTGILKVRFPGFAWLPRWTRMYLTPQTVLSIVVALFSAGVWYDNHEKGKNLSDIRDAIAATQKQMLKKDDIRVLAFQVGELWTWKQGIQAEADVKLKPITPTMPAPLPAKSR